jgi:phosphoenolpyruvate synthase/pyruvate phosphate dikinase
MFTNDPIKGDPSKMVLNLIEGDGEMLVSGHVNPSQVVISKRNMSIVETVFGF